jgi:hypothetical protein
MRMKKFIYLSIIIIVFIYCGPKSTPVERIMEDGVDVVINHLEPYEIKGEPSILTLEEEFSIDFARDDIAELGIARATLFEVDSQGNIYFFFADK